MNILTKDTGRDPVQTRIDIIQTSIKVYSHYLERYVDKSSPKPHAELVRMIEKEVKNLDSLKSRHPEYFI